MEGGGGHGGDSGGGHHGGHHGAGHHGGDSGGGSGGGLLGDLLSLRHAGVAHKWAERATRLVEEYASTQGDYRTTLSYEPAERSAESGRSAKFEARFGRALRRTDRRGRISVFTQLAESRERQGDRAGAAQARVRLAESLSEAPGLSSEDLSKTLEQARSALRGFEELDDPRGRARVWMAIGGAQASFGQRQGSGFHIDLDEAVPAYEKAIEAYGAALDHYRRLGDRRGEITALTERARARIGLARISEDPVTAHRRERIADLAAAASLAREHFGSERDLEFTTSYDLAYWLYQDGRDQEAVRLLIRCTELRPRDRHRDGRRPAGRTLREVEASHLRRVADDLAAAGNARLEVEVRERAAVRGCREGYGVRDCLRTAALCRELGEPRRAGLALLLLADCGMLDAHLLTRAEAVRRAAEIFRGLGEHRLAWKARRGLWKIRWQTWRFKRALVNGRRQLEVHYARDRREGLITDYAR